MLSGKRSVQLSYYSEVEGQKAVFMSATIPAEGKSTVNKVIQDNTLYSAHKTECREDMTAFDNLVYAAEDERDEERERADEN